MLSRDAYMDILILHGWNLSSYQYIELTTKLRKKGHRVFVPDMPGFGVSPLPTRAYKLSDYVRFVSAYIDKHKIKKPVIIGHSFGGRIGIKIAANTPQAVHTLVLTGVPGVRSDTTLKLKLYFAVAKIGRVVFSIPLLSYLKEVFRRLLYKSARVSDYNRVKGVMRATFKNIIAEDLIRPMKQIAVPTQLIWGENDTITSQIVARKMLTHIHGSTLEIIKNAGHSVVYKQPDRFLDALTLTN